MNQVRYTVCPRVREAWRAPLFGLFTQPRGPQSNYMYLPLLVSILPSSSVINLLEGGELLFSWSQERALLYDYSFTFFSEDTRILFLIEILSLSLAQDKSEWLYACLDRVNQINQCTQRLTCTLHRPYPYYSNLLTGTCFESITPRRWCNPNPATRHANLSVHPSRSGAERRSSLTTPVCKRREI